MAKTRRARDLVEEIIRRGKRKANKYGIILSPKVKAPEALKAIIFEFKIEVNAEGSKLAYLSKKDDGSAFRIAGPKAWGGSKNLATIEFDDEDLTRFIVDYVPELVPMLVKALKEKEKS